MTLIGLLVEVLSLVGLAAAGFGVLDAARRPASVFPAAAKQTKGLWIGLLAVSAVVFLFTSVIGLLGIIGAVATIVYFVDVRPAVAELSGGSGGSSGPYGRW